MLYAIMSEDVPDSAARRKDARSAHLARIEALHQEGRLVIAGPHPTPEDDGATGSLIVADFKDDDSARQWADADPFVAAGVYAKVTVKPFKQVLP